MKGLETGTHLRPSEVMAQVLPGLVQHDRPHQRRQWRRPAGGDGARRAAADSFVAEVQAAMAARRASTPATTGRRRVRRGLKNIYAVAAGLCDGLRLGDNAKTLCSPARSRNGAGRPALGAKLETFYGLSGFGDLVAAGLEPQSEFGQKIGEGRSVENCWPAAGRRGYRTTEALRLCREKGITARS